MPKKNKDYLTNLPPELMENILKDADFKSVQVLRKVSPDLRNYIDATHLESNLRALAIDARRDAISCYIESETESVTLEYKNTAEGCVVICENKAKLLENQDFTTIARNDLKEILSRHNGVLVGLSFNIRDLAPANQFVDLIKEDLGEKRLETMLIECNVTNPNQVLPLLRNIESRSIRKIVITNLGRMEMSLFSAPLAEMDIWRRARELTVEGFVISGIPPNFFGFETMQICFDVLTAAHVFGFATAWINSRGFKLLQLTYRTFNESHRLPEQLGPNFFEGPVTENEIRSWFIPIPGTENTLFVSLNPGNSIVMRKMLTRNVQVQILFNQEHF